MTGDCSTDQKEIKKIKEDEEAFQMPAIFLESDLLPAGTAGRGGS